MHRRLELVPPFVIAVTCAAAVLTACGLASAQPMARALASDLASFRAGHQVAQHIVSPDGRALRLVRGQLSAPSSEPAEAVVERFIAEHGSLVGVRDAADLRVRRTVRLGASTVVRLEQHIDGIPIVGAELTALVDARGRLRLVQQSFVDPTTTGEFLLGPDDAARIAAGEIVAPAVAPAAEHAARVYLPNGDGVAAAYVVHLGAVPALLANWSVFIDGSTGEVLGRINRVDFDRLVLAWDENPVNSELAPATLDTFVGVGQGCVADDSLPPAGPDGGEVPDASVPRLCTQRLSARNCWDHHETIDVTLPLLGRKAIHTCTEYHMAVPNDAPADAEDPDDDLANDYYFDDATGELDYRYADDAAAGQDLFAEAHALYHSERIYEYFQAFGPELFDELRGGRILVSTNWRIPIDINSFSGGVDLLAILDAINQASDTSAPLFPFDNAMFMPAGNLFGVLERPAPSIIFFQGQVRDFGYDADVIYHEFTHAVVDTVVGGAGLGVSRRDEQGLHALSLAMNEAYADFFATAFNGNSVQGEYAMSGLPGMEPRDLAARPRHTCPERLWNEEHQDSAPYSEALWEIREALGGAVEHALFSALCTLTSNAAFDEGAAASVAAIESELGADAGATAETIFAQYGYAPDAPCERVVELAPSVDQVELLMLFGTQRETFTLSPHAPSVVQWRSEIPAGTRQVIVRYLEGMSVDDLMALIGGAAAAPGLLVRFGDEPISFPVTGAVSSNADAFVPAAEADPDAASGMRLVYHQDGAELPAGPVHLMVVNSSTSGGTLARVVIEMSDDPPEAPADADADADVDTDADGDADADADADDDADDDADLEADAGQFETSGGGCDCRAGAGGRLAGLATLLEL